MDSLNIKINLVRYLDRVNDIKYIQEKAENYKAQYMSLNSNYPPPLKLRINLNFSLMTDIVEEFSEMLINEPDKAHRIIGDLIIICIKVTTDWEINAKMVQLHLRVDSLPDVPQLKFCKTSPPRGLFNIQGVLVSRSTPSKYLESTVYHCSEHCCQGYIGERILQNESVTKCEFCGKEKAEITKARVLADQVLGIFIPTDFLDFHLKFTRSQGIVIDFQDDLYSQLELGIQYIVIAKRNSRGFTAWGVKPMLPESLVRSIKKYPLSPYPKSVVDAINSAREICGTSPWSTVSFLASQVAIEFYPVSSFMQLKTGLLLSLASTQGRKCPTSVFALGECASIMSGAARLCPRTLMATPSLWTTPSGIISLDSETAWLEAGPLLLASHGVLYLGNLPKFGSKFLFQITSAVDSELVTLQQKPGSCSIDPKTMTYTLKSAVWTHWKCNRYLWQDMHQLRTLIDVFGIPFLADIGCDDETTSGAIIDIATGVSRYEESRIIEQNDFKDFLGIISAQEVEMSEAASTLIKNYFVASRRERPDNLPIKAVKVLTAMCEAHARLSFRNVATYEDAVASIFLYEESVVSLFGKSSTLEAPKRECNETNSYYVAKKMDSTLLAFSDWLESYINSWDKDESRSQVNSSSNNSFFL